MHRDVEQEGCSKPRASFLERFARHEFAQRVSFQMAHELVESRAVNIAENPAPLDGVPLPHAHLHREILFGNKHLHFGTGNNNSDAGSVCLETGMEVGMAQLVHRAGCVSLHHLHEALWQVRFKRNCARLLILFLHEEKNCNVLPSSVFWADAVFCPAELPRLRGNLVQGFLCWVLKKTRFAVSFPYGFLECSFSANKRSVTNSKSRAPICKKTFHVNARVLVGAQAGQHTVLSYALHDSFLHVPRQYTQHPFHSLVHTWTSFFLVLFSKINTMQGYGSDWLIEASVQELEQTIEEFERRWGPPMPVPRQISRPVDRGGTFRIVRTHDMLDLAEELAGRVGVVNAANEAGLGCFLAGHACLDNQVHRRAGPRLRLFMAQRPGPVRVPEGTCVVSPAFRLNAFRILHTTTPDCSHRQPNARDWHVLLQCYEQCTQTAVALKLQCVLFPTLGTGVFGFPKQEAAQRVVAWITKSVPSQLAVLFCVRDQTDVDAYRDALRHV